MKSLNKERIIITGGVGMIGVNLIEYIITQYKELDILVIDNLSSGNAEYLNKYDFIKIEKIDISKQDKITNIIQSYKPTYVFHLAAHFANQNSVDFPVSDTETNILATIYMLEALRKIKTLKKFIYTSSSCVYGNHELMSEDMAIYPHETPYAINKYASELYTKYYAHNYNIPTISIRIFNTYGPYELPGRYRNVIPNFIAKAILGEDIIITGTGKESRDFTYVEDTAKLLVSASLSNSKDGEVFNGGTGYGLEILDLAKKIIEYTNSTSKIVFKERRSWDKVTNRLSDMSKSKKDLDYVPSIGIDVGLKKTVEWLKENIK